MKQLATAVIALSALYANATVENLLPTPQKVTPSEGTYVLPKSIAVNDPSNSFVLRNFLTENNITISNEASGLPILFHRNRPHQRRNYLTDYRLRRIRIRQWRHHCQ